MVAVTRSARLRGAIAGVACLAVLSVAVALPRPPTGPPACLFRAVTTMPCPSCGMTRAFTCLAHGRLEEAVAFNAASPVVFAGTLAGLVLGIVQVASGRDALAAAWRRCRRALVGPLLALLAIAWAANLVERLAPETGPKTVGRAEHPRVAGTRP